MQRQVNHARMVCELADCLAKKGWLPATAGNLSVKVSENPLLFAITRSGADKQALTEQDVILVDEHQRVQGETSYRPSAETIVHVKLYEKFQCGSVLHVHTLYNNLVSQLYFERGSVRLSDHELLKALDHWEEGAFIEVPIVENYHNLEELGRAVEAAATPDVPGVLVRNHGIYVWGSTPEAAKRYLEAFEFLFQYHLMLRQYQSHV
jgi:methylthioribulose-1-phosphate dehydratase